MYSRTSFAVVSIGESSRNICFRIGSLMYRIPPCTFSGNPFASKYLYSYWMFISLSFVAARTGTEIREIVPSSRRSIFGWLTTTNACATIDTFSELLRDFVDALGLERFVLAGHSMGGAIALDFALAYPQRLDGLVLIGAGATMPVSTKLIELTRDDFAAATELIVRYSYRRSVGAEELALYLTHLRRCNPAVLLEDLLACAAFDVTGQLGGVTGPTQIIFGAEDRMTPPALGQALHAALPGSSLAIVPNAGHNVMVEYPDLVAACLTEFLYG